MNLTETYTRMHLALARVGEEVGLRPASLRVLVAIDDLPATNEHGVSTEELERALGDLRSAGSNVRRALLELYEGAWAHGLSDDGSSRRRGVRTHLTLTEKGADAVRRVRAAL